MALRPDEFFQGKWSSELRLRLARANLIEGWMPKRQRNLHNGNQWIQYEERGVTGAKFYLAKPSVVAFDSDYFTAGLYIERGHALEGATSQQIRLGHVIDRHWHWHGLVRLWSTHEGRERFHAYVREMPGAAVSLRYSSDGTRLGPWEANPTTYSRALAEIERVPSSLWIDLVVGVQFSRDTWNRDPETVKRGCEDPITQAFGLLDLIRAVNQEER